MTDLDAVERRWRDWVVHTCARLGIDADLVDIPAIHALTKTVATELDRPLAPVSSFMLGLAIGTRGADADPVALQEVIEAMCRRAP